MCEASLIEHWDTNTGIPWRDKNREATNKIIKKYNKWVFKGKPREKIDKILFLVEYALSTWATEDGNSPGPREDVLEVKKQLLRTKEGTR